MVEDNTFMSKQAKTVERVLGKTYHDFRNTLGTVSGTIQLLQMELNSGEVDKEEVATNLDNIMSIINNFSSNSEQIMKIVRDQPIQYSIEDFDISGYCLKVTKNNERVFKLTGIEQDTKIEEGLIIKGDSSKIMEVIDIVYSNATDHIKENGGKIKVVLEKKDGFVLYSVSNDGIPISDEVQEYIFKPFYSSKSKKIGLGLFIASRYLNDWGGSIKYYSDDKYPNNFDVLIPINQ